MNFPEPQDVSFQTERAHSRARHNQGPEPPHPHDSVVLEHQRYRPDLQSFQKRGKELLKTQKGCSTSFKIKRNANQNWKEIPFFTCQIQKDKNVRLTHWWRWCGKEGSSRRRLMGMGLRGRTVNSRYHFKRATRHLTLPCLGSYSVTHLSNDMCMGIFYCKMCIVIAKNWKLKFIYRALDK